MTKREQELVDQHRAWRAEADSRPERPAEVRRLLPPSRDEPDELRAKILSRRARRADDARLTGVREAPKPTCAWCDAPRALGSTFCWRCEPHKEGILRVISLPRVEPVKPPSIGRTNRQWRSSRH